MSCPPSCPYGLNHAGCFPSFPDPVLNPCGYLGPYGLDQLQNRSRPVVERWRSGADFKLEGRGWTTVPVYVHRRRVRAGIVPSLGWQGGAEGASRSRRGTGTLCWFVKGPAWMREPGTMAGIPVANTWSCDVSRDFSKVAGRICRCF